MVKRTTAVLTALMILVTSIMFTGAFSASAASAEDLQKVADQFVSIGLKEEGYREGSNNYSKYGAYFGSPNGAWCDVFVLWCVNKTDSALYGTAFPKLRGCTNMMNWYSNKKLYHTKKSGYTPKTGDLIFYNTAGGTATATHIGIVTSADKSYCYTIEGNYSDKVTARKVARSNSTILGYATPDFSYAKNLIASFNSSTTKPTTVKPSATTTAEKTTVTGSGDRISKTTTTTAPVMVEAILPETALAENQNEEIIFEEMICEDTVPAASNTTTTSTSVTTTTVTTVNTSKTTAATAAEVAVLPLNNKPEYVFTATVNTPVLNVRKSADLTSEKLSVVTEGSTVKVLSQSEDYCYIRLENGIEGYVLKEYVIISKIQVSQNTNGFVAAPFLNVRKSADINSEKLTVLTETSEITVLEKTGDWYKVQLSDGLTGYVLDSYIDC